MSAIKQTIISVSHDNKNIVSALMQTTVSVSQVKALSVSGRTLEGWILFLKCKMKMLQYAILLDGCHQFKPSSTFYWIPDKDDDDDAKDEPVDSMINEIGSAPSRSKSGMLHTLSAAKVKARGSDNLEIYIPEVHQSGTEIRSHGQAEGRVHNDLIKLLLKGEPIDKLQARWIQKQSIKGTSVSACLHRKRCTGKAVPETIQAMPAKSCMHDIARGKDSGYANNFA